MFWEFLARRQVRSNTGSKHQGDTCTNASFTVYFSQLTCWTKTATVCQALLVLVQAVMGLNGEQEALDVACARFARLDENTSLTDKRAMTTKQHATSCQCCSRKLGETRSTSCHDVSPMKNCVNLRDGNSKDASLTSHFDQTRQSNFDDSTTSLRRTRMAPEDKISRVYPSLALNRRPFSHKLSSFPVPYLSALASRLNPPTLLLPHPTAKNAQ